MSSSVFPRIGLRLGLAGVLFFLSSSLVYAQSLLAFNEKEHNFGNIEWKKTVTASFVLTNQGSRALRLSDVRPDCNCTAVEWPRQAIAPGERAVIKVSYDAQMLGTFRKGIGIKTSLSDQEEWIFLSGRVVMAGSVHGAVRQQAGRQLSAKELSKEFAYRVDSIWLATSEVEFDDVHVGENYEQTLSVFNGTTHSYSPLVMHLPSYLEAEAEPETLLSGERGVIRFKLDASGFTDYGVEQQSVYLSRFPGDEVSRDNEIKVSATILPLLSSIASAIGRTPSAQSPSSVSMGKMGQKKRLRRNLELRNAGRAELVVERLEVFNPGMSVSLSNTHIAPGAKAKMQVEVYPEMFTEKGKHSILLITNDPAHQKIVITVQAEP